MTLDPRNHQDWELAEDAEKSMKTVSELGLNTLPGRKGQSGLDVTNRDAVADFQRVDFCYKADMAISADIPSYKFGDRQVAR